MVANRDVLAMLQELAALTKLHEESAQSFKVRAYENAAAGVAGQTSDVASMTRSELTSIKGVGKSIADKILEFTASGRVAKLDELRQLYPAPFVEMTKIPGLGPKTLKLIRRELGVENLGDLQAAIAEESLRELPGLGATSEEKIAKAIERLGLHGKDRRTPIAEAMPLAKDMVAHVEAIDGVEEVAWCGSLRRMSETVGDVDITVAATDAAPVMEAVRRHPRTAQVIGSGETKTSILTHTGLQVDVRVVEPEQFGAAALYFTGSKAHNIALRQRAIDRDMLLNEYGLFETKTGESGAGPLVASKDESAIYRALDLPFIPPELREGAGEIEAAAGHGLPELVEIGDIRGDLHYHSDRSGDGRSSVADMLAVAAERGYSYVAFTDHGEDLAINGSSRAEMLAHRDQIRDEAERHPDMTVLFGCELNIGPDGGLDYDPAFRAEFEWSVASVHSHFDLSQSEQTERLIRAISDPSVNAIGHLTGRYIGRRPGIELDVDAVLEALAITGVGLEVNGALDRLDASSAVIRRAVERGVHLVISTDSHHTSELGRMAYGVATARRGWAPRPSVANTRSTDEFLAWASAVRARSPI